MADRLHIDIETYSSVDIRSAGHYKYIESEDLEILMIAYAINDKPVRIFEPAELEADHSHEEFFTYLNDPTVEKWAHNATFERNAFKRIGLERPINEWYCSAIKAAYCGYPLSLAQVSEAMQLGDKSKLASGKALIRYFCIPCKPTKTNEGRTRNLPEHDMEKWEEFKDYCIGDVEAEREIEKRLSHIEIPDFERKMYILDQQINDRGILIDVAFAESAVEIVEKNAEVLGGQIKEISGVDNPNSPAQLKEWLGAAMGRDINSLAKGVIPKLIDEAESEAVKEVLTLRQKASKTSNKKYNAMLNCVGKDGRGRGFFQHYGASRTGRWCLTGDHEVLTESGWVRLDAWQGGRIICWSHQTEYLSFQKATPNQFLYEGDMISVEGQRVNQLSTPEHRMPVWTDGGWDSIEMKDLDTRFHTAFTGVRQTTGSLDHLKVRILIMVQADGHYTENGNLRLHFAKLRKVERCKRLLRQAGIVFQLAEHKDRRFVFTVKSRDLPMYLRMFKDKLFGYWLMDENPDVILEEVEHWEGYRCGPNSIQYSTTVKQNAEIIQAVAATSGRSATYKLKKRKSSGREANWSDAHIVNIWLAPGKHTAIRKEQITRVPFKGEVFCPSTKTGFFMVRRGGKIWITGNSGRMVQLQNLPRNYIKDLEIARELYKDGDYEALSFMFDNIPDVLSQLIRTSFIAPEGKTFAVADFSAIEARVIAWLAGEQWRLDVFNSHGKIYEASASMMFDIPIEEITKGSEYRQKGKIAELALGYQGAVGALKQMGAEEEGLSEEEMEEIVRKWRDKSPNIVNLWYSLNKAAIHAVKTGRAAVLPKFRNLRFLYDGKALRVKLPSGRELFYATPFIGENRFGRECVVYYGIDQTTRKWAKKQLYGGLLAENIIQAIARDLLAVGMLRLDEEGFKIVMHVHDEQIAEVPIEGADDQLARMEQVMGHPVDWAEGLPLGADGYVTPFYKKD